MMNIGTGVETDVPTIFAQLKALTGYSGEPHYGPPRLGDVPSIRLNAALAAQVLGWTPQVGIAEGMRAFVDWLRTQPT
jgi:nucleoside-diphosphate-sugar epimerase